MKQLILLQFIFLVGCAFMQGEKQRDEATTSTHLIHRDCFESKTMRVMQVLDNGILAKICPKGGSSFVDCSIYGDLVFMPVKSDENDYVDDQKVILPKLKCFQRSGRYQYPSKSGLTKTVRQVVIFEKLKAKGRGD